MLQIDHERYALKTLRGDFRDLGSGGDAAGRRPDRALEAAHRGAS
jgi:hypothetical protein